MNELAGSAESLIIKNDGSRIICERELIREHILSVIVNEQPLYRMTCPREYLKELISGRLYTDGLIASADDIDKLYFCRYENEASVYLKHDITTAGGSAVEPSCCTGNRVYADIKRRAALCRLPDHDWKPEWVFALAERFSEGTKLHHKTSGTHSCFLARENELLFSCEDIGRHNAVDKAVGYGLLNGIDLTECMIYSSGRVPIDMVQKVIAAGIPLLVSKSVPSIESTELAKEYNLNLVCRAYPDQIEVY